jgi:ribosomal protein S18 acetylase RimI-like enzyme
MAAAMAAIAEASQVLRRVVPPSGTTPSFGTGANMSVHIEPRHDLTPNEVDAIEDRLYGHNRRMTGCDDGQGLGFVILDDAGRLLGVAAGYTWAGISELKQMWIDEESRGRGLARALLDAFVDEARMRGVERIWVSSYDFQAPEMYEKVGFKRMAEFQGWPTGHSNVVLCKTL